MSEPFLGEIRMVGFTFNPRGWAFCNGQLLSISQNSALFSLLGTQYGGDGVTTFGLPDFRGRSPMHFGTGPGLTNRAQGAQGGTENVTLTQQQMPAHNHGVNATGQDSSAKSPIGNYPGGTASPVYATTPSGGFMNANMLTASGNNQPHQNMHPFLVVNFVIALEGIFPSRN